MSSNVERGPGLLAKLGQMTAIRLPEELEHKLLTLLGPMLDISDATLVHCKDHDVVRTVNHHRSRVLSDEGVQAADRFLEQTGHAPSQVVRQVVEQLKRSGRHRAWRQDGVLLQAYPLLFNGNVVGGYLFQRERTLASSDEAALRGVLAIFSNLYQLLDASRRDRLTGLLNRQALDDSFEKVSTCLVQGQAGQSDTRKVPGTYWLGIVDVDNFKQINDGYGHVIGDEVLLLIAQNMASAMRVGDQLFRFGGEEFVVVVATAGETETHQLMERLRNKVQAHVFPQVGRVTVSIGFAGIVPHALPNAVIANADRALYHAKRTGKNRVSCYEQLLALGEFQEVKVGGFELF